MSSKASFITPYCVSAYIVIQTLDGPRYLIIRRSGEYLKGTWQMVTGRVENGETAPQAALREIQEETGLTPTKFYCADAVETFYMQVRDEIAFGPVFVAFVDQMDVRLSPSEHDAFEWLTFEDARRRLTWAEQRRTILQVHEQFILQTPDEIHRIKM